MGAWYGNMVGLRGHGDIDDEELVQGFPVSIEDCFFGQRAKGIALLSLERFERGTLVLLFNIRVRDQQTLSQNVYFGKFLAIDIYGRRVWCNRLMSREMARLQKS